MKRADCIACRDRALMVEAYWFRGMSQPFPAHFHDYYVLGLVEAGRRHLVCGGVEQEIEAGDVLLFQPGMSHACTQTGGLLSYRALNVPATVMAEHMECLGAEQMLRFSQSVAKDARLSDALRAVHQAIFRRDSLQKRQAAFSEMLSLLMPYCTAEKERARKERGAVCAACAWIQAHYEEPVDLAALCSRVHLSKAALLRAFVREKGITPYRYLETVRIAAAKVLLQRGMRPAEAALRTGFADQSHFSRQFRRHMGLPPGVYRKMFQKGVEK